MLGKVKKFYKKHESTILSVVIGGAAAFTTGLVLGRRKISINNQNSLYELDGSVLTKDNSANKKLLEEFGVVYKNGLPTATFDVAKKFLEEAGNEYLIEIYDPGESAIWIHADV